MAFTLDRKEQAILRKEKEVRYAETGEHSVRDFDEARIAKMNRDQRLQKVRFYLKVRAKMGCPLLPKSV